MAVSGYVERPDYRVDILARRNLVRAWWGDVLLAESDRCLLIDEQDHGLVFYFPRSSVRFEQLEATDHSTYCPFKGHASYWRPVGDSSTGLAWSYETPFPEVARLGGCIAFSQDRVRVELGTAPRTVAEACTP